MTDGPVLDWSTSPSHFRVMHERTATELRQARREIDGLQRQAHAAEALHRENVMIRVLGAGTFDSVTGRAFVGAYNGELTTEAVSAAWHDFLAEAIGSYAGPASLREVAEQFEPDAPTPNELAEMRSREALR